MRFFTPAVRDAVLFVVGLVGIAYVTVTNGGDRPTLLVLFGAMIGLPAFLRTDEARKGPGNDAPPPEPPATPIQPPHEVKPDA